ncbi:hypothetical protein BDF19DRAFT_107293 [Syncephalis fuscata]|nr:hypothetical protein BDF19DRAFT_107293 [Syncephalis fuscata]
MDTAVDELAKGPIELLAAHLSLSVDDLSPLFTTASEALLTTIAIKVEACDRRFAESRNALEEERAIRSQMEVNRDRLLNQQETKLKFITSQQERLRSEVVKAQEERAQSVAALEQLQASTKTQQGDTQHVADELDEAKRKILKLEADLRDTNALLERRAENADVVAEEQRSLLEKSTEARAEIRRLEVELQQLRSSELAVNLREQRATQELTLAQQNSEWLTKELEAKSLELQRQRQERAEETTQLQTALSVAREEQTTAVQKAIAIERRLEVCTRKLEEALERQRDLEQQQAETDAAFKTEMEAQRRVCELWESGQREARERVEQLEGLMLEMRAAVDRAEERCRLAELQEAETQKELGQQLETQTTELDRLKEELHTVNELLGNRESLQAPNADASVILSPTAAAVSRMQKSGKTFTQIYSDYIRVQEELTAEQRENQRITESLTGILREIDERAPLLQKQREEYEIICHEATQLADQLTTAMKDREELAQQAEDARLHQERVDRENIALKKESERLALQVQTLIAKQQGVPPSEIAMASFGSPSRHTTSGTEVEQIITSQLTTFRNIQELQQQNQRLLKVTQDLASRLEQEENRRRQHHSELESEAIAEAQQLIQELRDRLQTAHLRIDSYTRERDLLRRMLENAGQSLPQDESGEVNTTRREEPHTPEPNQPATMDTGNTGTGPHPDVAVMLRELQEHFDAYRTESGADLHTLKEQLEQAQNQCTTYRIEVAQANAQVTYLNERYQLLVENTELQKTELQQVRERNAVLQEQQGRQELATRKANEELLTAREVQEKLRQECANLRAEKQLFQTMQDRMMQENNSLSQERANLNDMMRNLEQMQKEVERSSNEARTRFEQQLQNTERELETAKAKLNEESTAHRGLLLRKEMESKDYQTRIDKLSTEYQTTREQWMVAKTSLKHQNQRVSELEDKLQSAEERLQEYERPRTTGTSAANSNESVSVEEQQRQELVKLRGELVEAKKAVERAAEQVEQYRAISSASEEALASLQTTLSEFERDTEKRQADQELTITNLREKVTELTSELVKTTQEYSQLQEDTTAERSNWQREKHLLEERIEQLKRDEQNIINMRDTMREDLRRHAEMARNAQKQYQHELVAHAADVQALGEVKEQCQALQDQLATFRSETTTAEAKLKSAESSWAEQRSILQRNITELEDRCSELTVQNNNLQSYLDTAAAQSRRVATSETATSASTANANGSEDTPAIAHEQLQIINQDLRTESVRLRSQLDLKESEARRLRLQLTQSDRQLAECRALLMEARA